MDALTPILKAEKLTHVYGSGTPFQSVAIDGIDFEIQKGEFVGIIGHTGSGKSTFIQHLNGLIRPTSGSVYYNGEDIHLSKEKTREVRFRVGLVFQYPEYQLFEETVFKDIAFGPKNMRLSEQEVDERVREAAQFAGVHEDVLGRSPFELSGGQKRRVAIAGVIAMRPDVLILDEPTAGLDPHGCSRIIANITQYRRLTGSAVIMVTHNMEEAARCAERLVVLSGGRIAFSGTPDEVFSHEKELRAMGLDLPVSTQITEKLRSMGLPIKGPVYTTMQAKNAILAIRGGESHA
ncbi:MAG: energy-coupling factor transporter ATPase [Oscillospiraceae bacterium]